ncbi:MAG: DUF2298 domain-containing protein [Ktedonobacterales bacterium]
MSAEPPSHRYRRTRGARRRAGGADHMAASGATLAASSAFGAPLPATSPAASSPVNAPTRTTVRATPYAAIRGWLARRGWAFWVLLAIMLLALLPRLYGINWDANNHLHPDEREIVFRAMCLSLPGTPRIGNCDLAYTGAGWFFSTNSPLNPHFFAYGSFPLYLLALVAHGLAWLTGITHGAFRPSDGGAWDDYNHFTLIGRALSALFDTGSVLLAGLIGRRLAGGWAGALAAAFVAVIPFEVQVAHFYAVDTVLLFFVLLTLLCCVWVAQSRGLRADAIESAAWTNRDTARATWGAWGMGLALGASYALALASKVSALPLIVPMLVALALLWRRRGFDVALLATAGLLGGAIVTFLIVSPYTLIDWHNFMSQVNEQTALSQGKLDYPYVRQFTNTTPYVYEIQQMLLYDMGLPLGLLGLAGFAWAASRIWRFLADDWAILVSWLVVYFVVIGDSYTKFTRYMLPVFAPLAICAAGMLAALVVWGVSRASQSVQPPGEAAAIGKHPSAGTLVPLPSVLRHFHAASGPHTMRRPFVTATTWLSAGSQWLTRLWGVRWVRIACAALALTVLLATAFQALALVNIYSAPNTRVRASEWIYNHVPSGSTITYEVWDDALPILVPPVHTDDTGTGYTAAGQPINPARYNEIGLNLYDPDTPAKTAQLAQQLASANAVILSSQRLVRSIPKLPDRYPMTTRYYQLLFAGKLGFHLAAHFETHPNLLGVAINDNGADESFSVYDHPPVWIFTRIGPGLTAAQIQTLLSDGVAFSDVTSRAGNTKPLLLSPQNAAADAQSAPLAVQFPANSLPNQIPLLWWLLLVELLGVVSFPLAFSVFPGLRDRGWGLSKTLGLLLLAWAIWLPSSLRLLPFDAWAVWLVFALLAVVGALTAWLRRAALLAFLRERWRLLVVCEVCFLVAFLFFTWVRALDPDLWHIYRGGEKPMEIAFLNAILRSRYMPPFDPWYSGGYINYYYYGQYLIAVLIKLTGIVPTTAFNLAVPLIFGLTFTAAFSVLAGLTGRAWAGVAGGLALVVVGNLDGLWQALANWRLELAGAAPHLFDYWESSRVIPYTINEFPYWSFLYADLHAHLIDLPVVGLMIACCASLLADTRRSATVAEAGNATAVFRWRPAAPTLAMLALALGAAWCINTWDLPTYALLAAITLALALLPLGSAKGWRAIGAAITWRNTRNYALALALTFGGAYVLYLPFHSDFQNFVSGVGPVATPTDPGQFFTVFGLWLFLAASFFFIELRDRVEALLASLEMGDFLGGPTLRLLTLAGLGILTLLLAYFIGVKALLIVLLVVGLALALHPRHTPIKLLTYLLLLLGFAVALGVEFIYVRDFLDNSPWERMNTVFKFYYQVWTLLALGGALAFTQIIGRALDIIPGPSPAGGGESDDGFTGDGELLTGAQTSVAVDGGAPASPMRIWKGIAGLGLRSAWLAAFMLLLVGSSVFLFAGTQVRVQDLAEWAAVQPPPGGVQPQGLSLDGMAYMRGWYPEDYAAINWLNAHVAGDPTIVEASNGPYAWYGRVSIYTGLPDVLGWSSHEAQQRYPDQVYARQNDVQTFYGTDDPLAAVSFLRQYGVKYVYLGQLERGCYMTDAQGHCLAMDAAAQTKFTLLAQAGILHQVFRAGDTVIYRVVG